MLILYFNFVGQLLTKVWALTCEFRYSGHVNILYLYEYLPIYLRYTYTEFSILFAKNADVNIASIRELTYSTG